MGLDRSFNICLTPTSRGASQFVDRAIDAFATLAGVKQARPQPYRVNEGRWFTVDVEDHVQWEDFRESLTALKPAGIKAAEFWARPRFARTRRRYLGSELDHVWALDVICRREWRFFGVARRIGSPCDGVIEVQCSDVFPDADSAAHIGMTWLMLTLEDVAGARRPINVLSKLIEGAATAEKLGSFPRLRLTGPYCSFEEKCSEALDALASSLTVYGFPVSDNTQSASGAHRP